MKKEEMRGIVNMELKTIMPPALNEEQQKLWRFLFNMWRQEDLASDNPIGGVEVAQKCIKKLRETNPEVFLP